MDAPPPCPAPPSATPLDWLTLALTPGIGPVLGGRLLARGGGPARLRQRTLAELAAWLGADGPARALLADDPERDAAIRATLAWRDEAPNHHLIVFDDPRYPRRLGHLADPPLVLYLTGEPAVLGRRQLAIVGSRRATAAGLATATALSSALVAKGWVITSGLAEGIDRAAHDGALAGAAGAGAPVPTIAVMGTGSDRVYPARHRALAARIVDAGGALVTELPPGIGPLPANFPRRNRLIAALAEGVIVVEAARNSGSLITARLAADLGREVFAVPGSIHSPQARGCHRLLRDGATLVETLDDVEALFRQLPLAPGGRDATADSCPPGTPSLPEAAVADRKTATVAGSGYSYRGKITEPSALPPAPDDDLGAILALLAGGPAAADQLQASLGWPIERLLARLQRLQLAGALGRDLTGQWFRIR